MSDTLSPSTTPLKLTNGAKRLAFSALSLPGQFKTPLELFKAGLLQELFEVKVPHERELQKHGNAPLNEHIEALLEEQKNFFNQEVEVSITAAQRDLLRKCLTDKAADLPIGKHSNCLLHAVGLDEG